MTLPIRNVHAECETTQVVRPARAVASRQPNHRRTFDARLKVADLKLRGNRGQNAQPGVRGGQHGFGTQCALNFMGAAFSLVPELNVLNLPGKRVKYDPFRFGTVARIFFFPFLEALVSGGFLFRCNVQSMTLFAYCQVYSLSNTIDRPKWFVRWQTVPRAKGQVLTECVSFRRDQFLRWNSDCSHMFQLGN